ncbi:hypothetical protein [Rothia nasimurium]|uniref:hypothetical protein n=1 Tax=Rothia nasimurium TaxID=85336 RepID=UPI003BA0A313
MTDPEQNEQKRPSRYGRRLEDLSDDERAYYREFLPPQAPTGQEETEPQRPHPTPPAKRNPWIWFPHGLSVTAGLLALASFTLVPALLSEADADLRRNYAMLCVEVAFFLLVFAALLYGIFFLARFTDHDDEDDERLMRPTDFAERLYEQDIEGSNLPGPGSLYDSSWITGKNKD